MGRPENPVTAPPHLTELILYLRELRALADATYEDMAHEGDYSSAAHKRTASGNTVPKWNKVVEYVACCLMCGSDGYAVQEALNSGHLRQLWAKARMEQRGTLHLTAPTPRLIANEAELSLALQTLYERAGAPPFRAIQNRGGGPLHLSLSTLGRIAGRQALPLTREQLRTFLLGCRVREERLPEWESTWMRVTRQFDSSLTIKDGGSLKLPNMEFSRVMYV